MALFDDYDPNALHVCKECGGEFTDDEMANDEVCLSCDQHDHNGAAVPSHAVHEDVNTGLVGEAEDPDFAGMTDEDEDNWELSYPGHETDFDEDFTCAKCGATWPESEMAGTNTCYTCASMDDNDPISEADRNFVALGEDDESDALSESDNLTQGSYDDYLKAIAQPKEYSRPQFAEIIYSHDGNLTVKMDGEVYPNMTQFSVEEFLKEKKPINVVDESIFGDSAEHSTREWLNLFNASIRESTCFDKFMDSTLLKEHKHASRVVLEETSAVKYARRYGEYAQNRIKFK